MKPRTAPNQLSTCGNFNLEFVLGMNILYNTASTKSMVAQRTLTCNANADQRFILFSNYAHRTFFLYLTNKK